MKHQETHPTLDVEGCDPCKWSSISFGTVPGARRDQETGISHYRQKEKDLHRYREKRRAGEQPDGTTKQAMDAYDRKIDSWERVGRQIEDAAPSETVASLRKSTLNTG